MYKEEDARESMKSIDIINLLEFEETVDVNLAQFRCKSTSKVLNIFFAKVCDLSEHEDMKHACVAVGVHVKGALNVSLTVRMELFSSSEATCFLMKY